jgi:hypothetical protein
MWMQNAPPGKAEVMETTLRRHVRRWWVLFSVMVLCVAGLLTAISSDDGTLLIFRWRIKYEAAHYPGDFPVFGNTTIDLQNLLQYNKGLLPKIRRILDDPTDDPLQKAVLFDAAAPYLDDEVLRGYIDTYLTSNSALLVGMAASVLAYDEGGAWRDMNPADRARVIDLINRAHQRGQEGLLIGCPEWYSVEDAIEEFWILRGKRQ